MHRSIPALFLTLLLSLVMATVAQGHTIQPPQQGSLYGCNDQGAAYFAVDLVGFQASDNPVSYEGKVDGIHAIGGTFTAGSGTTHFTDQFGPAAGTSHTYLVTFTWPHGTYAIGPFTITCGEPIFITITTTVPTPVVPVVQPTTPTVDAVASQDVPALAETVSVPGGYMPHRIKHPRHHAVKRSTAKVPKNVPLVDCPSHTVRVSRLTWVGKKPRRHLVRVEVDCIPPRQPRVTG